MSEFPRGFRDDEALGDALKRAAAAGADGIVPEPVAVIAERGTRRRRRRHALVAACAVCVLAGAGAFAGLRLASDGPAPPAAPPSSELPSPIGPDLPGSLSPTPAVPPGASSSMPS
ncbi:cell wall synthesis protein CwsA [Streptomyces sp. NPDC002867]